MSSSSKSNPGARKIRGRAKASSRPNVKARGLPRTKADARKLVHELEVHQLELEMQNAELRETRSIVETLLQTYTDLYDFAPVGYLSVDETGVILEANLAGAVLLGLERSRLINRPFRDFIAPPARADCEAFIQQVISTGDRQVCAASLVKANGVIFSADIQAIVAASPRDGKKWARLAISDLTGMRQAEATKQQLKGLTVSNRDLRQEIFQRRKMEKALQTSESHYAQLLEKSQHQQEQLRHLSRQLLLSQEEERKRISRELHDEVLQVLVGINVHLASLIGKAPVKRQDLQKRIVRTQKIVTQSVEIVHQFARELRPTVLDDLGLIPALTSFINDFVKRTGLRVAFQACPEVAKLSDAKRTVLYRVAQAALTNVHKHSQAAAVKMTLHLVRNSIRMEIQDNGKSFNVERVLRAKRHRRLGLLGSRERVEMVGGVFTVESESSKGTTVRAEIPFRGS